MLRTHLKITGVITLLSWFGNAMEKEVWADLFRLLVPHPEMNK